MRTRVSQRRKPLFRSQRVFIPTLALYLFFHFPVSDVGSKLLQNCSPLFPAVEFGALKPPCLASLALYLFIHNRMLPSSSMDTCRLSASPRIRSPGMLSLLRSTFSFPHPKRIPSGLPDYARQLISLSPLHFIRYPLSCECCKRVLCRFYNLSSCSSTVLCASLVFVVVTAARGSPNHDYHRSSLRIKTRLRYDSNMITSRNHVRSESPRTSQNPTSLLESSIF